LDLGGSQSFDDQHGGATERAVPAIARGLIPGGLGWGWRWDGAECCEAEWQKVSPLAVSQEAEVADADKALGEQVQQEATQKLIQR